MLQFTEEELGEIIELTEEMCTRNGWVNEIVPPAKKRMELINRARSRPHNAPAPESEPASVFDIKEYNKKAEDLIKKNCVVLDKWKNHTHENYQKGIRVAELNLDSQLCENDEINCCNCGVPKIEDGEPNCNECVFSEQHDTAATLKERERLLDIRIRDLELIISLCKTLRHQFPDDISLEMTQQQHERELKKAESLRGEQEHP